MRKIPVMLAVILLPLQAAAQIFSLTADMAAIPTGSLDAGVGAALGKGHTLSTEVLIRPVYPLRMFYIRGVCRKYRNTVGTGPFIGVSGGYFNFSDGDRYGEGLGLGASVGYRFIVSKRIDLSLEAGTTLAAVRDNRYIRTPGPYEPDFERTGHMLVLMPFPLSFKIHYLF